MKHIVWDFNGTLFDDIDAVVGATNDAFTAYPIGPLTLEDFRAGFRRPIWAFYEGLLGRPLAEGEWERLDDTFHAAYRERMAACALSDGAERLLRTWPSGGRSQSLLSMWRHDELIPKITELGIDDAFLRADGLRGPGGGGKAKHLVRHLATIDVDPGEVLMIGDSADDALAARHVGAQAVLFTGGCESRATLEAVGVPVVDTLTDALRYTSGRIG